MVDLKFLQQHEHYLIQPKTTNIHAIVKTMFLSQKFANMCSTKALRDYFALAESQPTSATLAPNQIQNTNYQKIKILPGQVEWSLQIQLALPEVADNIDWVFVQSKRNKFQKEKPSYFLYYL